MSDRGWLLNSSAISCAKTCVKIIHKDFGIKLAMSDPDFVRKVGRVAEHLESDELDEAYNELLKYAGSVTSEQHPDAMKVISATLKGAKQTLLEHLEHQKDDSTNRPRRLRA